MFFKHYELCGGCRKPILGLHFVYLVWKNDLFMVPRNVAPPSELWFTIGVDSQATVLDGDADIYGTSFCCLSEDEQASVLIEVITKLAKTAQFSSAYIWLLPHSFHRDITNNQVIETSDGVLVSHMYVQQSADRRVRTITCSQHE